VEEGILISHHCISIIEKINGTRDSRGRLMEERLFASCMNITKKSSVVEKLIMERKLTPLFLLARETGALGPSLSDLHCVPNSKR
jgi:hypothetical protein